MATSAATDKPYQVDALFEQALTICQAGRFPEAEGIFRRILEIEPRHFDSLHCLGVVCSQLGNQVEALLHIDGALRIDTRSADVHNSRGNVLAALKRFEEALASFETAIVLDPRSAMAFGNRGNAQQELGQFEAAVASHDQAIALDPEDAEAYYGRGNALQELKRFDEAVASYDKAIELRPDHAEALTNRGLGLHELQRFDEAVASYDRAIALRPHFAEALSNRANALLKMKRFEEALAGYDRAVAIRPDLAKAWNNRSLALQALNRFEEAVAGCDKALAIRPDYAEAFRNRGDALLNLNRFEQALASYERALALQPDDAESFCHRGHVLQQLSRFDEAIASYDRAIALKPVDSLTIARRGEALKRLKRHQEALASFERALAIDPENPDALNGLAVSAAASCDWARVARISDDLVMRVAAGKLALHPFTILGYCSDPALQLICAQTYISHYIPVRPPRLWKDRIWRHEKIRLAYVATGFREHPMAYLTAELFELHDRSRFEIVGISLTPDDGSAVRARMVKAFDRFHDAHSKSDSEVARLLHEMQVDIAVDRSGYIGDARPTIFAHKPAPIQVSYIGFPGTLGADFYDYVLADPIVLPFDQQKFYAEKIVHLPECYLVHDSKRVIATASPTRQQAGLPERDLVFCCFNNNYKITPPIFDIWMRLLQRVKGSVLWLFRDNNAAETNLRKEAAARGIDPARLVFAGRVSLEQHLARHRLADLFLDTLPYNAHTTASDALWAGLPLITCRGEAFAGRVAASMLAAIGLPELVAPNLEEYESLAFRLANDPALLGSFRERLNRNRLIYPLFDTDRYRRHIEAAYTNMWEIWQRGESPQSFAVGEYPNAALQGR
jgi:protein O-GlcNAc transferase